MKRCFNALAMPLNYASVPLALLILFLGTYNAYASTCAVPGVYATIQAAIDDNSCTVIDVAAGNFTANVNVNRSVTIQGQGAESTIVDGNSGGRVFTIQPSLIVTLTNMTITNGNGVKGGGIYNNNSRLTLSDVVIRDNVAGNGLDFFAGGGGLYNDRGSVVIDSSEIISNTTREGDSSGRNEGSQGGGIFTFLGSINLNNSSVSYNRAGDGSTTSGGRGGFAGGIFISNSTVWLTNSLVTYNRSGDGIGNGGTAAGGSGGGVYNSSGTLILVDSTIGHNRTGKGISSNAGLGGGILNGGVGGTISLTRSTIHDNSTGGGPIGGGGGGIFSNGGNISLVNSTVSGNTATGTFYGGGGIYVSGQGTEDSYLEITSSTVASNTGNPGGGIRNRQFGELAIVQLQNSIVAANIGTDCVNNGGTYSSYGYNMDSDGSCGLIATGDISHTNPVLGSLAGNGGPTLTHSLLPGSSAIDAGSCSGVVTDQRKFSRPVDLSAIANVDDGCDIGAYEVGPNLVLAKTVSPTMPYPADTITYSIVVSNTGRFEATNAVISDTLPTGLNFMGPITLDPPAAGIAGTRDTLPILASSLDITAGQEITVTFSVTVDTNLTGSQMITNVATLTNTEIVNVVGRAPIIIAGEPDIYVPLILKNN